MDYKKSKAPNTTVTQDVLDLCEENDNIYESVVIIAKRANQIARDMKDDLTKKLREFDATDSLEEIFDNREQVEISRYFERLPKPALIATQEFREHEIYIRRGENNEGKA